MIKKANEIDQTQPLKALFYGQPGIGKTSWAMTAPSPLLIDCDKGIHRVSMKFRKDYIPVNSWDDIMSITREDLSPYKTIIIDTAGSMLDFLTQQIIKEQPKLGSNGGLTLQGYGVLKNRFTAFLSMMATMNKHIIFIAHDKEGKDGDNTVIRPDIIGGSLAIIMRSMDLVGYIESVNNRRVVNCSPTDRYYGKNTCNLQAIQFDVATGEGNLTGIFEQYFQEQGESALMLEDYMTLVDVIKEKIGSIDSPEMALEVTNEVKAMEVIWDSKLIAQNHLRSKLAELKLKYNKEEGIYESL
jgi:hypothetical protein